MTYRLELNDYSFAAAKQALTFAAAATERQHGATQVRLQSLTGIGEQVDMYLRGVFIATTALTEAARSAEAALGSMQDVSTNTDAQIADTLRTLGGVAS